MSQLLNLLVFFVFCTINHQGILLPSSVDVSPIYLRVNQLGYLPGEAKKALAFSENEVLENFLLIRNDGTEIVSIHPKKSGAPGWGRFSHYYEIDFTNVETEGRYFLQGETSGYRSQPFRISKNTYTSQTDYLLEFMRQQRCGYNPFLDIVCHEKDGRSMYGPMPDSTFVKASGGWHDAGDQLKYLITGSYATAHMLKSYELFPARFDDKVNALGQTFPNEIPDVLDEAKWGLEWILKMHPSPDQLIHQIADDRDHIGWKMPDNDISDYGWGKNSYRVAYFATGKPQGLRQYKSEATGVANLAGRCAAALAMAARIWMEDLNDWNFSRICLENAITVYNLGQENEGFQQGNSYGAPYRYTEQTWADDMEWGAAELFRITGEKKYLQDAIRYARLAGTTSWMNRDSAGHYQFYPFVNIGHFALFDLVSESAFRDSLAHFYRNGIDYTLSKSGQNAFGIGIPFIWCSNNLLTSLITQIILYEGMTGDLRYHDYLVTQRDWLFGRNPWGTSMFTGIPAEGEYPQDVHTCIWALTKREVAGGLIDGPVYSSIYRSLKGIRLYEPDEFAEIQNPYVVYHDDIGDYSTNEPTMDGTAGSILMLAYWGRDIR